LLQLTFSLPGIKTQLDARAILIWKDPQGHIGIRFEKLSNTAREQLTEWLLAQATA
jgi:hypothetical protein